MGFTLSDAEGHRDDSVGAGDSVQTADEVRQVVQHTQVVLHHDDVSASRRQHTQSRHSKRDDEQRLRLNSGGRALPVRGDEGANGDGSLQPLFNIQVTGRFVKHKTAADTANTVISGRSESKCEAFQTRASAVAHMSALWMQTTAQANLCSSPPDKSSTFLPRR